jgi:hypothetical protein
VGLPAGKNLARADGWLTEFVQGNLIGDFQKYSAMTVTGRQELEKIIAEQKLSETGFYEEKNYAQIGQLTGARYFLSGSVTKQPKGGGSLQLGIADTEKGERQAEFTKTCTEDELKKTSVLNEAAIELLTQMGVSLTAEGKQVLYAKTALAQGQEAEKRGATAEALMYYATAVSFDPSLAEAAGRLEALSGAVSTGGGIGQNVRSDIQRREAWLNVLKEAAVFFKDHKPYEIVYDPTLWEGKTDYQKKTVELNFDVALWPTAAFGALDNILAGMAEKIDAWGFTEWPLGGEGAIAELARVIRKASSGKEAVTGAEFTVEAALLNDTGRTIAASAGVLKSEVEKDGSFVQGSSDTVYMSFIVKAEDISDNLTVKISKIDGMDVETAGKTGYMRVSVAGTEYKIGDKGPAGGIIFYTMGGSGWRYLEAAPADLPAAEWGAYEKYIGGTEERTGSGKKNTERIVAKLKELGETRRAAQLCAGYELNGYRDWFLPSKDELELMYENLKEKGLGNFKDSYYWSSLEGDSDRACVQLFSDGSLYGGSRNIRNCVRAVRAF